MPFTPFFSPLGVPDRLAIYEQALLLTCLSKSEGGLADLAAEEMGARQIYWRWQPEGWKPSWALYLDDEGTYCVTVSGTQNKKQIIAHLGGAIPVVPIPGIPQVNLAHCEYALQLMNDIGPYISRPNPRVYWSGHSYGGSIVTILAHLYGSGPIYESPSQFLTFGAPRSFFAKIDKSSRGPIMRVTSWDPDPVSHMPPKHMSLVPGVGFVTKKLIGLLAEWRHVGRRVRIMDDGSLVIGLWDEDGEGFIDMTKATVSGWSNHFLETYLEKIERGFEE